MFEHSVVGPLTQQQIDDHPHRHHGSLTSHPHEPELLDLALQFRCGQGRSGVDRAGRPRCIAASRAHWRERHRTGCKANHASIRQKVVRRQLVSFRPDNARGGGVRVTVLNTGVAASRVVGNVRKPEKQKPGS